MFPILQKRHELFFIALHKVIAVAIVVALIGDSDKVPLLFAIEFQGEKERHYR